MHALSDDEQVGRLEKKVDDGFAEMRAEFREVRSEARTMETGLRGEIGALHRLMIQLFAGLYVTLILGFAAILLQHHL